jgi:hypothetical protein
MIVPGLPFRCGFGCIKPVIYSSWINATTPRLSQLRPQDAQEV